jgi:hypothetical protein
LLTAWGIGALAAVVAGLFVSILDLLNITHVRLIDVRRARSKAGGAFRAMIVSDLWHGVVYVGLLSFLGAKGLAPVVGGVWQFLAENVGVLPGLLMGAVMAIRANGAGAPPSERNGSESQVGRLGAVWKTLNLSLIFRYHAAKRIRNVVVRRMERRVAKLVLAKRTALITQLASPAQALRLIEETKLYYQATEIPAPTDLKNLTERFEKSYTDAQRLQLAEQVLGLLVSLEVLLPIVALLELDID